jgi:hypothetical protein
LVLGVWVVVETVEMGAEGVIAVGVGVAMAAVALTVVPVSTWKVVKSGETLESS